MLAALFALMGRCAPRRAALALILGLATLALSGALEQPAFAADLAQLKAAGIVGEKPDGFLAPVQAAVAADVTALISEINAKRQAEYEKVAASTGTTVAQVGAVTFEKLLNSGKPGYYLIDGQWVLR